MTLQEFKDERPWINWQHNTYHAGKCKDKHQITAYSVYGYGQNEGRHKPDLIFKNNNKNFLNIPTQ